MPPKVAAASVTGSRIGAADRAVDDENADVAPLSLPPFSPKSASDFAARLSEAAWMGANKDTCADSWSSDSESAST